MTHETSTNATGADSAPARVVWTYKQAADYWQCSKDTIRRKVERGELTDVRPSPRLPRVYRDEVVGQPAPEAVAA